MPAGQLVGPVAGHDHHRRVGQRPGQEAQQVPGRLVGPVDVLHDHHQRAVLARPLPQLGDRLEQLQPDGVALRRVRRSGRAAARRARGRAAPAQSSTCSRPCWATRSRRVPTTGAYGSPSPPSGTHWPRISWALRSARRTEQVGGEGLDDRGLAGAGVAADDARSGCRRLITSSSTARSRARWSDRPTMCSARLLPAVRPARPTGSIVPSTATPWPRSPSAWPRRSES